MPQPAGGHGDRPKSHSWGGKRTETLGKTEMDGREAWGTGRARCSHTQEGPGIDDVLTGFSFLI